MLMEHLILGVLNTKIIKYLTGIKISSPCPLKPDLCLCGVSCSISEPEDEESELSFSADIL